MLCLYSLIIGKTFTKLTIFSSINNAFTKKDKSITYRLGDNREMNTDSI